MTPVFVLVVYRSGKKTPRGAAGTHTAHRSFTGKKTVQRGQGKLKLCSKAVRTRKLKCPRLRGRAGRSGGLGILPSQARRGPCGSRTGHSAFGVRRTCIETSCIARGLTRPGPRPDTCAAPTLAPCPCQRHVHIRSHSGRVRINSPSTFVRCRSRPALPHFDLGST
jgi:hypothetical protein